MWSTILGVARPLFTNRHPSGKQESQVFGHRKHNIDKDV